MLGCYYGNLFNIQHTVLSLSNMYTIRINMRVILKNKIAIKRGCFKECVRILFY